MSFSPSPFCLVLASLIIGISNCPASPAPCLIFESKVNGHDTAATADSSNLELYTLSGLGLPFTAGNIKQQLLPALSTKLGFQLIHKYKPWFFYPSANFLVFDYDEPSPGSPSYALKDARATITSITFSAGYRHRMRQFTLYEFAGAGGSMVKEPRATLQADDREIRLSAKKSYVAALSGGIGVEYQLGEFVILVEGSYLHNFHKIQRRDIGMFPVLVGFKSNISGLLKIF